MLLIGIIKELERQLKSTEQSNGNAAVLSYFFCQGTDSNLNNATAVLRGLTYLLLEHRRSLISRVRKRHDHAGRQLFEDSNALVALSKIFREMLLELSSTRVYLVIDALDECISELPQLLRLITSISPQARWIVSSRNKPEIEQQLDSGDSSMKLSLELTHVAEQVTHAVNAYIDFKVTELRSLQKMQSGR